MFELIIILSLAIIFFIFLIRMPEAEKIEGKEKGNKKMLFLSAGLNNIITFFKGLRLKRVKLRPVKKSIELESQRQDNGEVKDLYLEAERKLKFGDLDGAEKLYLRLAIVAPHEAKIYASLGHIYLERQSLNDAVSSFKAAINRDQKNGFYYYDLATALFKLDRNEEAIICFEKSILINNRIPIRHLGLGLVLMKMGEYERAADSFRRAISIEPNNEKYKRLLKKAEVRKYSSTLN